MSVHVAILLKRYIRMIISGEKTIESRLTKTSRAPYRRIESGDVIHFKASSGPYMAKAVADKVRFFEHMTPDDVARIKARYNDRIRGDEAYWQWKRDSRYATLVLLRGVEATSTGPAMRPSQGIAWFVLDDTDDKASPPALTVTLTAGAIRNGYVRVPRHCTLFPVRAVGGATAKRQGAMFELLMPDGATIETDITARHMLRWRGWRAAFTAANVRPGDAVRFEPIHGQRYRVRFVHVDGQRA